MARLLGIRSGPLRSTPPRRRARWGPRCCRGPEIAGRTLVVIAYYLSGYGPLAVVNARRRWVAAGAAIATLVIVAIAALHSPPVRSRLLAIITARLDQNGVVARVDGLDYNLFTRTVHLSGVTLATPSAAATPFFSANDVRATFPLRTFFGHLRDSEPGA